MGRFDRAVWVWPWWCYSCCGWPCARMRWVVLPNYCWQLWPVEISCNKMRAPYLSFSTIFRFCFVHHTLICWCSKIVILLLSLNLITLPFQSGLSQVSETFVKRTIKSCIPNVHRKKLCYFEILKLLCSRSKSVLYFQWWCIYVAWKWIVTFLSVCFSVGQLVMKMKRCPCLQIKAPGKSASLPIWHNHVIKGF